MGYPPVHRRMHPGRRIINSSGHLVLLASKLTVVRTRVGGVQRAHLEAHISPEWLVTDTVERIIEPNAAVVISDSASHRAIDESVRHRSLTMWQGQSNDLPGETRWIT